MRILQDLRETLLLSKRPALAFMMLGMCWGGFAALVPQIKLRIGVGDGLFGTLLLLSAFGLVSAIWLAPKFERWLRASSLPLAVLSMASSFLLIGWAPTPALFGVAMFLAGACSGLTDVLMNTRVSEIEAREDRPMMSFNHAMFSFAYAFSALMTGLLREAGATAFLVFLLYFVVILGLVARTRIEPSFQSDHTEAAEARKLPHALIALGGLVVMIAFMTEASIESWSALHVERSLGGRAVEGALGPFLLGFTMGIGRLTGQTLASRLNDTKVIFWASLMTCSGAIIAAIAAVPFVAYLGFAILGMGVSVIAPLALGLVGRRATAHTRSTVIARVSGFGFLGFFLSPALMGWLSAITSLRVSFIVVGMMVLLIPLILLPRLRRA